MDRHHIFLSGFSSLGCYTVTMTPDRELLQRYHETDSEEAFAELVRRYLDLVYTAALRQVNGDAHLAQDVAQTVFSDLARKAVMLARREILSGWLYTATYFAAAKAVRTERRRFAREQEAEAMHELFQTAAPDVDWDKLRSVLDDVMHELNEADRDVILMRYFENRPLADIGERLGLREDTARKRVDRALEKLRIFLLKRGITTAGALATMLSANAVEVAPSGLAATLTKASLIGSAAGTGTTVTLLKLITMTKLQASLITAVIVAGVATPLVIQHQTKLLEENAALRRGLDELPALRSENDRLSNLLAQANNSASPSKEQLTELLKLRGEVGSLRRQTNELATLKVENQDLKAAPKNPTAPASPTDSLPRESWVFAGYADPESAFQSAVWARSQGDAKTYLASLSPQGQEFKKFENKSEEVIASELPRDMDGVTGFKIVDKEMVSDDEAILTIFADGIKEGARFKLQRIGNDWKFAGPVKGSEESAKKGSAHEQRSPVQGPN
jgi:RNA polymerase sigma factor (sigma-70 family)